MGLISILYASSIVLSGLTVAAPICSNITKAAGGGLPNTVKSTSISDSAVKELQLALDLENLKVSFLQTGLSNIAHWGIEGYPNNTLDIVSKIAAQDKVHVASIVGVLEAQDAAVITPCNYSFPITCMDKFIALGKIITSIGVGSTIGLAERVASTDPSLVRLLSSIATVESCHNANFRYLAGKVSDPAPFNTGISNTWAYNLALQFVEHSSCPVKVAQPILPVLTNLGRSHGAQDTSAQMMFAWDSNQTSFVVETGKQLFIGWLNQLNVPVYTNLTLTDSNRGIVDILPGLSGVVFAAVTSQQLNNADDLVLATLAGPVVVDVS